MDLQDDDGRTVLMMAPNYSYIKIAKTLINKGFANVNLQDDNGMTALIKTLEKGYVEIVKLLKKSGAYY